MKDLTILDSLDMNQDLQKLIETLPFFLQNPLKRYSDHDQVIEIILDLGRRPEVRLVTGSEHFSQKIVSWQDMDYIIKRVSKFSTENRAGIDRTLNRISCIRTRQFLINGLTCRVGRSIFGSISGMQDLLESQKSILILGKPGIGKTTIIREIARILSNELQKRVIIIDTSNEIGGESDIPHPGIGTARRMQVSQTEFQHQIMMEAVENHMPQVIIIDEIATELEVLTARTIAEKGVQLVGTTHGNCLENLVKNPSLVDLIGGIQYVTLSDEEAKKRGTQKTILERKTYPTFEIVIEINQPNSWTIHEDAKNYIDSFLRNQTFRNQNRYLFLAEKIKITSQSMKEVPILEGQFPTNLEKSIPISLVWKRWRLIYPENAERPFRLKSKHFMIYPYSLPNNLLKEVLFQLGFNFRFTQDIQKATLILGFQKNLTENRTILGFAQRNKIPIYTVNQISFYQFEKLIRFFHGTES